MPHRGGKPQFVVLCFFDNPDSELRPDPSEVERPRGKNNDSVFDVSNISLLESAVNQIISKDSGYKDSAPLYGAMLCLQGLIKSNPAYISEILKYTDT